MRQITAETLFTLPIAGPTAALPRVHVDVHVQADGTPTVWRVEQPDEQPQEWKDWIFQLARFTNGEFQPLHFTQQPYSWAYIRELSGGRLLLMDSCSLSPEGSGGFDGSILNAEVFDSQGRRLAAFNAGDAIEDVQVTTDDRIWCSYFDEADGPYTSATCFDWQGRVLFDYGDLIQARRVPSVIDCYAMNAASERETWLYTYPDFPLVQLVDRELAGLWPSVPVAGACAFAVHEQAVLFAGSYGQHSRLYLFDRDTGAVEELALVDAAGTPITLNRARSTGRGPRLYLCDDKRLYGVDMRMLMFSDAVG